MTIGGVGFGAGSRVARAFARPARPGGRPARPGGVGFGASYNTTKFFTPKAPVRTNLGGGGGSIQLTAGSKPPGAPTPPPTPAPSGGAAPSAPPAPAGGGSQAAPLDSTALANIAANQFRVNNQINALNLERGNDSTSLQGQLAQLAYQQPRAQLALEQRANQAGSLYSSAEGQNQGNLAYQFAGRQGGLQSNYNSAVARIASQIAALQGGIPIYNAGQSAASAARLAAQAAANPPGLGNTTSTTAPTTTAPGGAPSGSGVRSRAGRTARRIAEGHAKGPRRAPRPVTGSLGGSVG